MKSFQILLVLAGAAAIPATAQPVINSFGAQNAAATRQGTPNLNLAPGAIVALTGQNLGPFSAAQGDPANPAMQLGGVSVQVASGGYANGAVVVYASYNEVDILLPSDVPTGQAGLTLTYNGQGSNTVNANVAPASFSAFTMDTQDNPTGVWQSFVSGAPFAVSNLSGQAQSGQSLTLVGTGLGGTTDVAVFVGNTPADVTSVGPEDCCSGLDHIVFTVPSSADGCLIGVSVKTGSISNVVAPISVTADGRFCPDQTGFSPDDIAKAKANGSIKVGYLFLLRFAAAAPAGGFGGPGANAEIDFGWAQFSKVSYDDIVSFRGLNSQAIPGACWGGNTNGAQFNTTGAQPGIGFFEEFYPFGNSPLDAGSAVHLTGAGTAQTLMPAGAGAYYGTFINFSNPLQSFLQPGQYTFDASGGADVPGFSTQVTVNPVITFSGTNAINSVDRTKDLTITWTGGGNDDRVLAILYAASNSFTTSGAPVAGIAACSQLASGKQLTIPAAYLSLLPATSLGEILLYSEQIPSRSQPSSGLDAVYMMTLGYTAQQVSIQ